MSTNGQTHEERFSDLPAEQRRGRPRALSDVQTEELLQRLTDGHSLASIVKGTEWPSYRTIYRKIEADPEFRERYERARAIQAERWADELVTLSDSLPDDATAEQIAVVQLMVDTRKWIVGKRLPKVYGDRPAELTVNNTTNNNFLVVSEARQRAIQERTRQLLQQRENTDSERSESSE